MADAAREHLAHRLGNNWGHRRVKNDERDAADLVDLLRMGRLAEAWIAPPELRELRELVRYRAKLVNLRSGLKAQVTPCWPKRALACPCPTCLAWPASASSTTASSARPYAVRVESPRDVFGVVEREVAMLERRIAVALEDHAGYHAVQAIPGVGAVLAAVFVAEIGDVNRFPGPRQLCSWAGLAPATVSRTPLCTEAASPNRAPAWCAGLPWRPWLTKRGHCHPVSSPPRRRSAGKAIGRVAAARKLLTLVYYGLRDGEIRSLADAG